MVNLLYELALLFGAAPFFVKNFSWQRLSFSLPKKKEIWVHASSVGEITGIKPFLDRIRKETPYSLVLSCMTKTGYSTAISFSEDVFYLPLDFRFTVRRAIKRLNPKMLIISETELWPNLIREAKEAGCKVVLINGRITEKSKRRYQSISSLMKEVLSCFDLLLMQSEEDAERMIEVGAQREKIKVTGNTKFDWLQTDVPLPNISLPDKDVVIFGSIREKEEEAVLSCCRKIAERFSDTVLIVAPRHISRVPNIVEKAKDKGLSIVKRSECSSLSSGTLLVLDTMGELKSFYKASSIAFVGGTLSDYGGHNIIEPALFSLPVLFGPYIQHFREQATRMKEMGGGIEVADEKGLLRELSRLLEDKERRRMVGKRAKDVAENLVGASERSLSAIMELC